MVEQDKYHRYANIPIPTYEEAVSRPSSSQAHRGAQEVSDDAERQGLLGQNQQQNTYHPPTVESARSSVDSDLHLPEVALEDDVDDRRHIEELDYLDPSDPDPSQRRPSLYHRARLRSKFAQRLSSLGATLSSIRLPSFRSFYHPVAHTDAENGTGATTTATGEEQQEEQTGPQPSWSTRAIRSLPTIPPQYRISAPNAARVFGLLTLILLIYFLLILDVFPGNRLRDMSRQLDPEAVRSFVQQRADAGRIGAYLEHLTRYDHVAGTEGDFFLAEWMREKWVEEGGFDDTAVLSYYPYLNYPTKDGRSVKIVEPEDKRWTAVLEENTIDPSRQQTLAWHGYSKSGEAEGRLIYANYGTREDFDWLKSQGVESTGSIALVRANGPLEDAAWKVRIASESGCVGVLIYSDPSDDGSSKGQVWPNGPWRPEDSLQRDGVAMTNWIVGDPLTPGWASKKESRIDTKESTYALPKIPSLPLAWRDAKVLLSSLEGHGPRVPENWVGGSPDFSNEWFSGTTDADDSTAPTVNLRNMNDESEKQQIWNVHGMIRGFETPEKKIIIGNHHDAWCFGSVSPGSGSAIMMEVISIFGELRTYDWRPLRTIEFVSWDASEYNLVGSTEYVEDNIESLRENAIAYLNVDTGVYGPDSIFRASGSPIWQRSLIHAMDRVGAPGTNMSVRQVWDQRGDELRGLGTDSDYVAFQDMAGTSSLDFGFEGAPNGYPRHSCYETLDWMGRFGDPGFEYSLTLAQIWALLILDIADRPIVPYDATAYAEKIRGVYLDSLQTYADSQFEKLGNSNEAEDLQSTGFTLDPIRQAGADMFARAQEFHKFETIWTANVMANGGFESTKWFTQRTSYNEAISRFDGLLLDLPTSSDDSGHGVPNSPQFKHVIFGPQLGGGQGTEFFPFVREALSRGDWAQAQKMVEKTAEIIGKASAELTYD